MTTISRQAYAEMFGPTTGDRMRLADTELWIEVEEDRTRYGDEVKFGGGKVIRDGMGQSQRPSSECVDTVITNALTLTTGVLSRRISASKTAGLPASARQATLISSPVWILLSVRAPKPLPEKDRS